jgi:hypothetical protein
VHEDEEENIGNYQSGTGERERERTESHTNVHLFERTLVVATCFVERKEK